MNAAERIIEKFGGTRPAAEALAVPPSTVQSWKRTGVIPARRQQDVLSAAKARKLDIQPADFFAQAEPA